MRSPAERRPGGAYRQGLDVAGVVQGSFERQDLAWLPGQLRNVFDAIRDGPDNAERLQDCV
jgi:hypothetical protein